MLLNACQTGGGDDGSLEARLAQARTTALVAAIVGTAGGELVIDAGEHAGTVLTVPPGAVAADAVFSLTAAEPVAEDTGYVPAGPMVKVESSASVLLDLSLTLPYDRSIPAGYGVVALFLRRAEGQVAPVGGAFFEGSLGKAAIRPPGAFGVAADPLGELSDEDPLDSSRCPLSSTVTSLGGAIQATGSYARFILDSPAAITAETLVAADGCGRSASWEVGWYSEVEARGIVVGWQSNTTQQIGAINALPASCGGTFTPVVLSVNTPALTGELIESSGVEPVAYAIRILSCYDSVSPPRIRLDDNDSPLWAEYTLDGERVAQSF